MEFNNNIGSVCVYCGSSGNVRPAFRDISTDLGRLMAKENIRLVYGGGHVGLMGLVADSVMKNGGQVTGIIPHFLDELEVGHAGLTELIKTDNMHDRKMRMAELSDGFIVLPGGLGTLDETFEILTWKQLKLHDKPVVILNVDGYWDHLISLIHHQVEENFARQSHLNLFTVAGSAEEAIAQLRTNAPVHHDLNSKWT